MYFKDDSISREGVINTVKKIRDVCDTESLDDYRDLLTECFEVMPPVQPEIVRCKDCEFTDGEKPIADGRYWCVLHSSFMYFCSDAERRKG